MAASLRFESTLEHDGDGLVRFTVWAANEEFSASIGTWGQANDHLALASALKGFPTTSSANLTYTFGMTGTCELTVSCLDSLGHVGVWVTLMADWPAPYSNRHQTASIFFQCDPASIDTFVSELLGFSLGSRNSACLLG